MASRLQDEAISGPKAEKVSPSGVAYLKWTEVDLKDYPPRLHAVLGL